MRPIALALGLWLAVRIPVTHAAPLPAPVDAEPLLARLVQAAQRGGPAADAAAFELGQLRYARGEYVQAAEAYGRAAAARGGAVRGAAVYHRALAELAAGRAALAERSFAEASRLDASHRALARLGAAFAMEAQSRFPSALDAYARLLSEDAGEAGPAALERFAELAARQHRDAEARSARENLRRRWPRSFEAARMAGEALR